jgi:uncharacterized membrane protein
MVLFGSLGVAGAWLGYAVYLGITYDMLAEVMIGAVKIVVAVAAVVGLAVVAAGWAFRRFVRSAFPRDGSAPAVLGDAAAER